MKTILTTDSYIYLIQNYLVQSLFNMLLAQLIIGQFNIAVGLYLNFSNFISQWSLQVNGETDNNRRTVLTVMRERHKYNVQNQFKLKYSLVIESSLACMSVL